ncbi:MAG: hypothetical protein IPJ61_15225 [Tessaracoccus sp.]|uniref:hypothetical protein n=1 Tax=Tessaracoccus sp. TaxID=1971211 RepID=UPI001EBBBB67|nr:hypothetical protein [Tessaracoccus sp.]MBK7822367.1 hypothetical protein [Tessaracoccus sp.]
MSSEQFQAFISYARSTSTPLATALQSAVERFAKPWYRLRATRIFRDDTSMSANTALWSTIETGLRQSQWLVLLTSPEAAVSEYVTDELRWWLEHKSADTILLVQGSGDLWWDRAANRFDAERSPGLPAVLVDAYREEPRWIDLRWFGEEGSLGTADPRFEERVADIAATVRGEDRDSLVGENVRQHKRARRLARGAIVALTVLLVAALVAGVVAVIQATEAARQRDRAEEEARIATARQLAATAQSLVHTDIVKARLLADQAFRMEDDALTRAALLQSITSNPYLLDAVEFEGSATALAGSADGKHVVVGTSAGAVLRWDRATDTVTTLREEGGVVTGIALSADGRTVAASFGEDPWRTTQSVAVWRDGATAEVPAEATGPVAVSPSGEAVIYSLQAVSSEGARSLGQLGVLRDVGGAARAEGLGTIDQYVRGLTFADDERLVVLAGAEDLLTAQHRALGDFALISQADGGWIPLRYQVESLSASGSAVAVPMQGGDVAVYSTLNPDMTQAARRGAAPDIIATASAVSSTGARVAVAGSGAIYVSTPAPADAEKPDFLTLTGSTIVTQLQFLESGQLVSAGGGRVLLWDLDRHPLLSRMEATTSSLSNASGAPKVHVNRSGTQAIVTADELTEAVWHVLGIGLPQRVPGLFLDWHDDGSAFFVDPAGDVVLFSPDGSELARHSLGEAGAAVLQGDAQLRSGEVTGRYLASDDALLVGTKTGLVRLDRASGTATRSDVPASSLSASGAYAVGNDTFNGKPLVVSSVADARTVAELRVPLDTTSRYQGELLVAREGSVTTVRTADGADVVATLADNPAAPLVIDQDTDLVASFLSIGRMQLSSLSSGIVLGELPLDLYRTTPRLGYGFSGDGERLVISYENFSSSRGGGLAVLDLSPARWTEVVCTTVGRSLTADEWEQTTGRAIPADLSCGGTGTLPPASGSTPPAPPNTDDATPLEAPGSTDPTTEPTTDEPTTSAPAAGGLPASCTALFDAPAFDTMGTRGYELFQGPGPLGAPIAVLATDVRVAALLAPLERIDCAWGRFEGSPEGLKTTVALLPDDLLAEAQSVIEDSGVPCEDVDGRIRCESIEASEEYLLARHHVLSDGLWIANMVFNDGDTGHPDKVADAVLAGR